MWWQKLNPVKGVMSLAVVVLALAGLLSLACSPQAIPSSPSPSTTLPTSSGTASLPALTSTPPSSSQIVPSEDPAWAQVVAAAKKEGRVTLYSYGFVGDIGIAILRAFQEKYGITLDIVTGRGAEFVERLKTEQRVGRLMADTMEGSHLHLTNAKVLGLTAEVASGLPSLKKKDVWFVHPLDFYDPEGHVLAYNYYLYSPFVNTNLVKPQDYPKVSGNVYTGFVPLISRKILSWDYIDALDKQDLRLSTGLMQEGGWLARGERELSLFGTSSTWGDFIVQGAPLKAIPMEDGMVAGGTAIEMIKNSPHPNAARVFINWLFSAEGQQLHAKVRSVGSIRKDVVDYTPAAAQVTGNKIIAPTSEDADLQSKLFREGFVTKLWQQK